MVVLLDLDEDAQDPHADPSSFAFPTLQLIHGAVTTEGKTADRSDVAQERPNPNINNFSAALGCYPIVCQITRFLDLNTLHALSRTCRQIRANLLQYRRQLVAQSLRCENDISGAATRGSHKGAWQISINGGTAVRRLTSGKVGACARDMVSDCRRCSRIVCRNCTIKPPSSSNLPKRHRRLCSTCLAAPLSQLTSQSPHNKHPTPPLFTTPAFTRDPCRCQDSVFLCQPCGYALPDKDTTYKRVWTWRARYSRLGTGIGEGNEGVKCGRGEHCLGAKDIEVEIDCGAEEIVFSQQPSPPNGEAAAEDVLSGEGFGVGGSEREREREREKAGYWRQEVEGIGGVVKKKVKKRVRVGKTVREYEDERETSVYLAREIKGESRSWCGWCERVVPGRKEFASEEIGQ